MCIAVRIAAMIPITRFRPSSMPDRIRLSLCVRQTRAVSSDFFSKGAGTPEADQQQPYRNSARLLLASMWKESPRRCCNSTAIREQSCEYSRACGNQSRLSCRAPLNPREVTMVLDGQSYSPIPKRLRHPSVVVGSVVPILKLLPRQCRSLWQPWQIPPTLSLGGMQPRNG